MSEQEPTWAITPQPITMRQKHEAVIDGLEVTVERSSGYTTFQVRGWLADLRIVAGDFVGVRNRSVETAKAAAVTAAHRLHAAGVRGSLSYPTGCCDQLFATRDGADQHEAEHLAAKGGEADADAFGVELPVHFGRLGEPVCAGGEGGRPITTQPDQATCPDCRDWLDRNAIAGEDRAREAGASEQGCGEDDK